VQTSLGVCSAPHAGRCERSQAELNDALDVPFFAETLHRERAATSLRANGRRTRGGEAFIEKRPPAGLRS